MSKSNVTAHQRGSFLHCDHLQAVSSVVKSIQDRDTGSACRKSREHFLGFWSLWHIKHPQPFIWPSDTPFSHWYAALGSKCSFYNDVGGILRLQGLPGSRCLSEKQQLRSGSKEAKKHQGSGAMLLPELADPDFPLLVNEIFQIFFKYWPNPTPHLK